MNENKYLDIIRHYADFPIPGIDFIDIMPFLQNKEVFRSLVHDLDRLVTTPNVVTVEARGFLFAAPLLTESKTVANIVPIRKKGKLPFAKGDLHDVAIMKEYGEDHVYYRLSDIAAGVPGVTTDGSTADPDTIYVSLFDDILATGGTAIGIAEKMNRETVRINGKTYRIKVKEFIFLVELASEIPGASDRLTSIAPVHSIIKL